MGDYTNGQYTYHLNQQSNAQWTPVMSIAGPSVAMLPPANTQQFPHNLQTSAIQHQWQAPANSYRLVSILISARISKFPV
jgi:hypothetical protein